MTVPVVTTTVPFIAATIPAIATPIPAVLIVASALVAMVLVQPISVPWRPFALLDDHWPSHTKLKSVPSDEHLGTSAIHFIELPVTQRRLALQIVLIPQRPLVLLA